MAIWDVRLYCTYCIYMFVLYTYCIMYKYVCTVHTVYILLYSQTKGVKQKYSQFICHLQQDTVIWNAITTL